MKEELNKKGNDSKPKICMGACNGHACTLA